MSNPLVEALGLDEAAVKHLKKVGLRALARGGAAVIDSAAADSQTILGGLAGLVEVGRKKLRAAIPRPEDE